MSNFKVKQYAALCLGCKWSLVQIQSCRPILTSRFSYTNSSLIHRFSPCESCLLFQQISSVFTRLFGENSGSGGLSSIAVPSKFYRIGNQIQKLKFNNGLTVEPWFHHGRHQGGINVSGDSSRGQGAHRPAVFHSWKADGVGQI